MTKKDDLLRLAFRDAEWDHYKIPETRKAHQAAGGDYIIVSSSIMFYHIICINVCIHIYIYT